MPAAQAGEVIRQYGQNQPAQRRMLSLDRIPAAFQNLQPRSDVIAFVERVIKNVVGGDDTADKSNQQSREQNSSPLPLSVHTYDGHSDEQSRCRLRGMRVAPV